MLKQLSHRLEHNPRLLRISEHCVRLASASRPVRKHSRIEAIHDLLAQGPRCQLKHTIRLCVFIKSVIKCVPLLSGPMLSQLVLHLVIIKILRISQNNKFFIKNLHDWKFVVFLFTAPEGSKPHSHHDIALGLSVGFFIGLRV